MLYDGLGEKNGLKYSSQPITKMQTNVLNAANNQSLRCDTYINILFL